MDFNTKLNRCKEVVMLFTFVGYRSTVENLDVVLRWVQNDKRHIISVKNIVTVKTLE